jgi:hypothetical protein
MGVSDDSLMNEMYATALERDIDPFILLSSLDLRIRKSFTSTHTALNMAHHPIQNNNASDSEHFQDVLERARLSRRGLIRGGLGLAALSSIPLLAACGGTETASTKTPAA